MFRRPRYREIYYDTNNWLLTMQVQSHVTFSLLAPNITCEVLFLLRLKFIKLVLQIYLMFACFQYTV